MGTRHDSRGFTLIEVLLAVAIITIALLALLSMLSAGSVNVYAGGGQSKATAFARQQIEFLRNVPVNDPRFAPGNDPVNVPERGITRRWTVVQTGPTVAPNRLWTITVTVTATQTSTLVGSQNITLWTMRSE